MQQQKGSSIYKTKFLSTQLLLYYDAIITNCTYKTTKQPHNRTSVPHTVLCTVLFQIQKEGLLYLYYLSLLHELLQETLEWNVTTGIARDVEENTWKNQHSVNAWNMDGILNVLSTPHQNHSPIGG